MRRPLLLLFALIQSFNGLADPGGMEDRLVFGFHPNSILSLGRGFDPGRVDLLKNDCLTFESRPEYEVRSVPILPAANPPAAAGVQMVPLRISGDGDGGSGKALWTELNAYLVTNASQFRSAFGIDLSMDASYLTVEGDLTFKSHLEQQSKRNSVTVIIRAKTEYANRFSGFPRLVPFGEKLIQEGRFEEFVELCGSHYVAMARRGSAVSAIIRLDDISDALKQTIQTSSSVSGGFGPVTGGVKMALNRELSRASQEKRIHIELHATGGTGINSLAPVIRMLAAGADQIDQISLLMSDYFKTFTEKNSAPLGFVATRIPYLPAGVGVDGVDTDKRNALIDLVDRYRSIRIDLTRLEALLDGKDSRGRHLHPKFVEGIKTEVREIQRYADELESLHRDCLTSREFDPEVCHTEDYDLPIYSRRALRLLDYIAPSEDQS